MQAILWPIAGWVLREVVVKSVVIGGVYVLLTYLVPMAVSYITPYLGTAPLSSVVSAIPDGVFFFMVAFRLDVGIPMLISAYIARFLVRRLPLIG